MNEKQALRIAAAAITEQAKVLAERANRYHMEPQKWPNLEKDYIEYQKLIDALRIVEEKMLGQGRLF